MRLIFVGAQGSGKGTQAKMVAKRFGLCHISSGNLLREVVASRDDGGQMTEDRKRLGKEVSEIMSRGGLVSDELIIRILKERLKEADCEKGFILDGFPRNVSQAEKLKGIGALKSVPSASGAFTDTDKEDNIDKVIEIEISDKEAVRRVCGRRNCLKCGAIYNVNSLRPRTEGICDECGGELTRREDDSEDALIERLKIYHDETEKILRMYDVVRINGEQSIEKVFGDILQILG